MNVDALLAAEYYKTFLGGDKLYARLKDSIPGLTRKYVNDWLKKQDTVQQLAPSKSVLQYKITSEPGGWQADIMFFNGLERENHGCIGILLFEQIESRFALIYKLPNKAAATIASKFVDMCVRFKPSTIASDNGSEFKNKQVQEVCKKYGVEQFFYAVGSHTSLGTIDSLTKTIRMRIRAWMQATSKLNWVDAIDDIIEAYNDSVHSSLGRSPAAAAADVGFMERRHAEAMEFNRKLQERMDIAPGDRVRYKLVREKLAKGGAKWSDKVYEVERADGLSYLLKGSDKRFRPWQLMKVGEVHHAPIEVEDDDVMPEKPKKTLADSERIAKRIAKTSREVGDNQVLPKRIPKLKVKN